MAIPSADTVAAERAINDMMAKLAGLADERAALEAERPAVVRVLVGTDEAAAAAAKIRSAEIGRRLAEIADEVAGLESLNAEADRHLRQCRRDDAAADLAEKREKVDHALDVEYPAACERLEAASREFVAAWKAEQKLRNDLVLSAFPGAYGGSVAVPSIGDHYTTARLLASLVAAGFPMLRLTNGTPGLSDTRHPPFAEAQAEAMSRLQGLRAQRRDTTPEAVDGERMARIHKSGNI